MSRYTFDVALLNYIQSLGVPSSNQMSQQSYSTGRAPTSAEIDAVIAAAIANAPPAPSVPEIDRSVTPLMTNLLPSAVGQDGRVNLFVGNVSIDTFKRQGSPDDSFHIAFDGRISRICSEKPERCCVQMSAWVQTTGAEGTERF